MPLTGLNKKENDCQCWHVQSIIVDEKTRSHERNFRNRENRVIEASNSVNLIGVQ